MLREEWSPAVAFDDLSQNVANTNIRANLCGFGPPAGKARLTVRGPDDAFVRVGLRLIGGLAMRPVSAAIATVIGLILSSAAQAERAATHPIKPVPLPLQKHEWRTQAVPAANDVVASFKHTDGAELSVICNTDNKRLTIAFQEPRAKWTAGQGIDVITLPDSGQQPSPSGGFITGPTEVVLKHDPAFDLWTMAQASDSFKLSVGDFARVFPAANFREAVAPVLKACGDHW